MADKRDPILRRHAHGDSRTAHSPSRCAFRVTTQQLQASGGQVSYPNSPGHGIVWNIGDSPVDGATDLLFMWMIAGFNRLGVGIETAARVIGTVAHLTTIVLIFVAARTLGAAGRTSALLSSTYVAIGPAKVYIAGGFGTTVFAACVTLGWFTALRLAAQPSTRRAVACGCAFVLMGVARPEGALLAVYSVIALALFWSGDPDGRFLWPLCSPARRSAALLDLALVVLRLSAAQPVLSEGNGHLYYGNLLITPNTAPFTSACF
jgi:hypothetical protein